MTELNNLTRYVTLESRKRELRSELDAIENEMKGLETQILDEWTKTGQTGAKVGGYTIYVNRQLWAGLAEGAEGPDVAAALGEAGLAWMATANWQKLSSYVRELDQEGAPLPRALEGVVSVREQFSLRARKAS